MALPELSYPAMEAMSDVIAGVEPTGHNRDELIAWCRSYALRDVAAAGGKARWADTTKAERKAQATRAAKFPRPGARHPRKLLVPGAK